MFTKHADENVFNFIATEQGQAISVFRQVAGDHKNTWLSSWFCASAAKKKEMLPSKTKVCMASVLQSTFWISVQSQNLNEVNSNAAYPSNRMYINTHVDRH